MLKVARSYGFIHKALVGFLAELIHTIAVHGHKNGVLQRFEVIPFESNGQFIGRATLKGIDEVTVLEEKLFCIGLREHGIVDVRKLKGLSKAVAHLEGAIVPNRLDGDNVLNAARNAKPLFVLLQNIVQGLNHAFVPPFRAAG